MSILQNPKRLNRFFIFIVVHRSKSSTIMLLNIVWFRMHTSTKRNAVGSDGDDVMLISKFMPQCFRLSFANDFVAFTQASDQFDTYVFSN